VEFVNKSTVRLIKHNASDEDVAHAAWVSNFGTGAVDRDTTDVSKLINFLYTNKHMSPFEHGSFTFFIDTPIFVAREFMRHRTFSYNETSGRYKELEPRFYLPSNDRPIYQQGKIGNYSFAPGEDAMYREIRRVQEKSIRESWRAYKDLLSAGIAKEVARNTLPVATMTQFYATCNPRNLMQFLTLRNDDPALYEIRAVAVEMEKIFAEAMPLTYASYARARDEERNPPQVVQIPQTYNLTITNTPSQVYTANQVRKTLGLPVVNNTWLADRLLNNIDGRKS